MIGIKWNGTEFAAAGRSGDILTSPDGINWAVQYTGNSNLVEDDIYGDDHWVGVTLGGHILRSGGADGSNPPSDTTEPQFLNLQVGPNSNELFKVPLTDVRTTALGVDEVDVSTSSGAQAAIAKIDKALGQVSSQQATYGADQNALKYTMDNVLNYQTNLTSPESRLTDTDMASEFSNITMNQALTQGSIAMLAQANQLPNMGMKLLST